MLAAAEDVKQRVKQRLRDGVGKYINHLALQSLDFARFWGEVDTVAMLRSAKYWRRTSLTRYGAGRCGNCLANQVEVIESNLAAFRLCLTCIRSLGALLITKG